MFDAAFSHSSMIKKNFFYRGWMGNFGFYGLTVFYFCKVSWGYSLDSKRWDINIENQWIAKYDLRGIVSY